MKEDEKAILAELTETVRRKILSSSENLDEETVIALIEETVLESEYDAELDRIHFMIQKIYGKTRSRLGMLEHYLNDDSVSEIMLNGKDRIFLERSGRIVEETAVFDTTEELEEVIRNIAAGVHREINEMHPILDARLADGSRVNAVCKNIAADGPVLTIRKFARDRITAAEMTARGTLSRECAECLGLLVESGYNIFVSGGTSSGKTTFLNALSDFIPSTERVIVIEDSAELQLSHISNLVQMECRNANVQGEGLVSMDMLIRTSLRMRPDRIIVGEVRGREVSDMLQAMNTGHDGSMSTGHGNSVNGMLRRLEAMYLMGARIPLDAIRAQIVEGIDIMVHLGRLENGNRKVLEVQELVDFVDGRYVLNPLFLMNDAGHLESTGNRLKKNWKLKLRGKKHDCRL